MAMLLAGVYFYCARAGSYRLSCNLSQSFRVLTVTNRHCSGGLKGTVQVPKPKCIVDLNNFLNKNFSGSKLPVSNQKKLLEAVRIVLVNPGLSDVFRSFLVPCVDNLSLSTFTSSQLLFLARNVSLGAYNKSILEELMRRHLHLSELVDVFTFSISKGYDMYAVSFWERLCQRQLDMPAGDRAAVLFSVSHPSAAGLRGRLVAIAEEIESQDSYLMKLAGRKQSWSLKSFSEHLTSDSD